MTGPPRSRPPPITNAVLVYVILLLSLQIFLLTVAVEGLLGGDPGLAWASTAISAVLALGAVLFLRYLRGV